MNRLKWFTHTNLSKLWPLSILLIAAGAAGFVLISNHADLHQLPTQNKVDFMATDRVSNPITSPLQPAIDLDPADSAQREQLDSPAGSPVNHQLASATEQNTGMTHSSDLLDGIDFQAIFKDSALNTHTANIAELLQMAFESSAEDLGRHFQQVENFLRTRFEEDDAIVADFMGFYRDYSEFRISQSQQPHPLWLENPETMEDAIRINLEKQQYRRAFFGQTVADQVWGIELKDAEINMKILQIVRDEDYGSGTEIKEQLVTDLQFERSDDAQTEETIQKTRLYVKLATHGEELLKMTDEERNAKIAEFRSEIYSEEEAGKLEQIEREIESGS
jgi:hypothetical protein